MMDEKARRQRKFTRIIIAYPLVLILIAVLANFLLFGVTQAEIALPQIPLVTPLAASAILLLVNHTLLMTSTELTRLKYDMHATPEEREASGHAKEDVSQEGIEELARHQNAHNNATENIVYFSVLALLISLVSPVTLAAQIWIVGFAAGRLGHSASYLLGRDGLRGIFMSISLLSLYGLASYLAICLFI
jgi:uncharacterized MAPEG superfamily protein